MQIVLLKCFLTLLRKKLNGKPFLTSNSRCVLGNTAALNLIYGPPEMVFLLIALVLPNAKGVAVGGNAKRKLSLSGVSCCCGSLPVWLTEHR